MNEIDKEIVKISLDKMLNGSGHFSICDLDKLGKLLGTNVKSHPAYLRLSALHCIDYREMSASLKQEITTMVMECLTSRFDTGLMSKAIAAIKNGEIKDEPFIEDSGHNIYRIGS